MAKGSGTTRAAGSGVTTATRSMSSGGGSSLTYSESQNSHMNLSPEKFREAIEYERTFRAAAAKLIGNEEFYDYTPSANYNRVYKTDAAADKSTIKDAYDKSVKEFKRAEKAYEQGYKKAVANVNKAKTTSEKRQAESIRDAFIHNAVLDLDRLKGTVSDNASMARKYLKIEGLPRVKHNFRMIDKNGTRTFKYVGK